MKEYSKVQLARMRNLMTQKELAKKAGVSRPTIIAFEKGVTNPHPATIQRIADALNVEVSDLF